MKRRLFIKGLVASALVCFLPSRRPEPWVSFRLACRTYLSHKNAAQYFRTWHPGHPLIERSECNMAEWRHWMLEDHGSMAVLWFYDQPLSKASQEKE